MVLRPIGGLLDVDGVDLRGEIIESGGAVGAGVIVVIYVVYSTLGSRHICVLSPRFAVYRFLGLTMG